MRRLSATPCPVNESHNLLNRRDSTCSNGEDTTANIDFTTEFKASFRDVKPRRPPGKAKKPTGNALGLIIHEDEELTIQDAPRPQLKDYSGITHAARRTSISQAQHPDRQKVSFAQPEKPSQPPSAQPISSSSLCKAPRRASLNIAAHHDTRYGHIDDTLPHVPLPKMAKKPARRGTIYIPNDDTTMPSMYMGIFSPLKNEPQNSNQGHGNTAEEHTGLAAQMLLKKASSRRQSVLVASPKRGPLHPTARPVQAAITSQDRVGNGSGKENLPPGFVRQDHGLLKSKPRKSILLSNLLPVDNPGATTSDLPISRLFAPTASTLARLRDNDSNPKTSQKPTWNSAVRPHVSKPPATTTAMPQPKPPSPRAVIEVQLKPKVPTRFIVPSIKIESVDQSFPLLPEGLPEVSMYEDNWLGQQEVAITQLINNLFTASVALNDATDAGLLRLRLLEQYNGPEMVIVYKRIQGALVYGALSVPQDVLVAGHRLYNDLGRRKVFTDLWLETYDAQLLHVALEVVVGRTINIPRRTSGPDSFSTSSTRLKKVLRLFIEAFLMRNEDGHPDSETNQASWSYSRTLIRSIMLIKVLDLAKTTPGLSNLSLFQTTSHHKTSPPVVKSLFQMLNPSAGDPLRALSLLGYSVTHAQYPLEEYSYPIQNLAIDLRDGVRLTRLVELLLYRSTSPHLTHLHSDSEATSSSTILMPTGETLNLTSSRFGDWPLSQHLKLPCTTRATRLFNVQIALSAISGVKGMEAVTSSISAEDIVDGFRENTMKLLWALTSKWGLEGLVDWHDIKSEIRRMGCLKGKVGYSYGFFADDLVDDDEEEGEGGGYLKCKALLKSWAKAVAGGHGLTVRNFTTSFADGRVFEAIVDEYEMYLTAINTNTNTAAVTAATAVDNRTPTTGHDKHKKAPLSERLQTLGCSTQFAQLFAQGPGAAGKHHIFDRDFVLASLAFLASRLLKGTRMVRMAVVVQRAWRRRWEVVMARRRVVLRKMAEGCGVAVKERDLGRSGEGGGGEGEEEKEERSQEQELMQVRRGEVVVEKKLGTLGDDVSKMIVLDKTKAVMSKSVTTAKEESESDIWLGL